MNAVVIEEGASCWTLSGFEQASVLVDAQAYYTSFCNAALAARHYIYISGWQFDTLARLLRPQAGQPIAHPVELVPFLNHLCEANPNLEIYITAWDYSLVYALEREWLQKLKFDFRSHARVHFEFLDHPEAGGCHHQKLAIIDGEVGFLGGLDLCDSRWDTRQHKKADPDRIDLEGKPYKPFHDIQVALRGPVVGCLERLFLEGWRRAGGEDPSTMKRPRTTESGEPSVDEEPARLDLQALSGGLGLPLAGHKIAVSRTEWPDPGQPAAYEIQTLFERAITAAERMIFIETQYFTSRAMAEALYHRLADPARSKLEIVLVMPDGADSPKEDFVLGNRQRKIRRFVADVARHHGHEFRLLMSKEPGGMEKVPATFIHSKLMIVDDEFLTIGSANFTNRSMLVDREVNVAWDTRLEAEADRERLTRDIRALRASLLAEHAGIEDDHIFSSIDGLMERIDGVCNLPDGKLRCQVVPTQDEDDPLLIAIFDPSGPLDWDSIDDSLERVFDFHEGAVKRGVQKIGQRLGVVDIE